MERIKVKLIVDPPKPAWCAGKKGQIFEVFDSGNDYYLQEDFLGPYLDYDQCEVIKEGDSHDK